MIKCFLVWLLGFVVWSLPVSAAGVTAASMTYKNFARESADDRFRNLWEMTGMQIRAARTRWSYETNLRLEAIGAASHFETQLAFLTLATEEFYVTLYEERAANAEVREHSWRTRAAAVEAGRPEPLLDIAQADLDLRKQKLIIAQKLVDWSNEIDATSRDLEERAASLLVGGAMDREDYNFYLELKTLGRSAVTLGAEELVKARELLQEAQRDLDDVTGHAVTGSGPRR